MKQNQTITELIGIPSTNLVLPNAPLVPNFAPCEKIRKPVRQLTNTAKKRPARPVRRVYLAIELWQKSELSQVKFCFREKLR